MQTLVIIFIYCNNIDFALMYLETKLTVWASFFETGLRFLLNSKMFYCLYSDLHHVKLQIACDAIKLRICSSHFLGILKKYFTLLCTWENKDRKVYYYICTEHMTIMFTPQTFSFIFQNSWMMINIVVVNNT